MSEFDDWLMEEDPNFYCDDSHIPFMKKAWKASEKRTAERCLEILYPVLQSTSYSDGNPSPIHLVGEKLFQIKKEFNLE